ncbi:hypothetical protein KO353_09780 [Elioraea tepida]|jgi:hypothetical protein|uniref:Uncharacterized protein n=1 Tax=Elioraea tepida TaxID=2843330 RepID=A0A975YIJ6_9PROT|nr:DUF6111 family protein [Elioraea tepida]QXM23606.1 hypothetical protein KO353_09780 [Elioraea tepida]
MRGVLQAVIPFLAPFVLYFFWAWLARRPALADPRSVPWIVLCAAGLALSAGALLWFAETASLPKEGRYEPARIEGGRIIDGGMRPATQ